MESVSSTGTQNSQAVTPTTQTDTKAAATGTTDDFDTFLKGIFGPSETKEISEEELFAGIIQQRLKELKGDKALEEFKSAFSKVETSSRVQGGCGYEVAAKKALRSLVKSETITKEEGDRIYTEAFDGAQLDTNKDVLFDSVGGGADPTKAVALISKAIGLAKTAVTGLKAKTDLTLRSLEEDTPGINSFVSSPAAASNGSSSESGVKPESVNLDGANGFLFKPVSDTTGKLVVLAPEAMAGHIQSIVLRDADNKILDKGIYSGNGNGGRDHYRFSKPGASYPDSLTVEFTLKNGEVKKYLIADPSKRYD